MSRKGHKDTDKNRHKNRDDQYFDKANIQRSKFEKAYLDPIDLGVPNIPEHQIKEQIERHDKTLKNPEDKAK